VALAPVGLLARANSPSLANEFPPTVKIQAPGFNPTSSLAFAEAGLQTRSSTSGFVWGLPGMPTLLHPSV
jgi:hypothetical protein